MSGKPRLTVHKLFEDWTLRGPDGSAVVHPDGFTAKFSSRGAAVAAAARVVWNDRDEWWEASEHTQ